MASGAYAHRKRAVRRSRRTPASRRERGRSARPALESSPTASSGDRARATSSRGKLRHLVQRRPIDDEHRHLRDLAWERSPRSRRPRPAPDRRAGHLDRDHVADGGLAADARHRPAPSMPTGVIADTSSSSDWSAPSARSVATSANSDRRFRSGRHGRRRLDVDGRRPSSPVPANRRAPRTGRNVDRQIGADVHLAPCRRAGARHRRRARGRR